MSKASLISFVAKQVTNKIIVIVIIITCYYHYN